MAHAASAYGVAQALTDARLRLRHHDTATLDAALLLCHVLDQPRSFLHTHVGQALTASQCVQFENLIERRACGEPVAYLTGSRGFWSLELCVTQDTLIPRPETELLVEQALERVPPDAVWRIADLGTGSGAIALSIAHERPRCHIMATDISAAALEIARANAERLNIRNIEFRLGTWFDPLQNERFDMIVSNPPYVKSDDPHLMDLRFEPELALVAGVDGLQHLRAIAERAREHFTLTPTASPPSLRSPQRERGHLRPSPSGRRAGDEGGWLLLEHGYDQGREMMQMLADFGYTCVQDYADLAGMPRTTVAQWVAPHE
ncbi:MAG: peptide chain release factor N(5)-glutamine methyltransferase [Proteobacteria bacterium]|nr:peptide chain release factor N(5)-glutamine methyltransferase [Pseudomonadota bacterium]